jgi:dipeptidase
MKFKKLLLIIVITLMLVVMFGWAVYAQEDACTEISVGKNASVDGSVITSHSDCGPESRVHVVPAADHKLGEMAPVYWGGWLANWDKVSRPYNDYGEIIGYIPQVEHTYAYFHSAYPHMNEHQLAIGENTLSQKPELEAHYGLGLAKQIMSVEMLQIYALQRCTTAREAIEVITSLAEKYGFIADCGTGSEGLAIADKEEVWILELFSIGDLWDPNSGEPGVLWAAQRLPDDHVTISANYSIIKELDPSRPDQMASSNYMQIAIDHGWYDPASGKPFNWQEAYCPPPTDGNLNRLWLFYSTMAPSLKDWHTRSGGVADMTDSYDPYHVARFPASYFPFSVKPEKKVSIHDVIAIQRSAFEGTLYDMTADHDWLVPDSKGGFVKSPLTTPFPDSDWRALLDINYHRTVSRAGYGCVLQVRDWLPDPIGGLYWFYVDHEYVSMYAPIYAGVQNINPLYNTFDYGEGYKYSDDSARWAIRSVFNVMGLKWQKGIEMLRAARDPLEAEIFAEIPEIDKKALELYNENPEKAKEFLTQYTWNRMDDIVDLYHKLFWELITKLVTP